IVHDEWMEVAIAGVEYIGNAQSVLVRHLAHAGEHARQRSAWNRAIHAVVIRRDAANRGKCYLPARPEQLPLGLIFAGAAGDGAVPLRQRLDDGDQMFDLWT